jgi:WD40 repeat protein
MYVVGIRYRGVDIWDYSSRQFMTTLSSPTRSNIPRMYSCSSDCGMLATFNGDIQHINVWDIADICDCKELPLIKATSPSRIGVGALCFLKYSDHLVVGFMNNIALYDARSASMLLQMSDVGVQRPDATVTFIHSHPDRFITVTRSGVVQDWNLNLTEIGRQEVGIGVECACAATSGDSIAIKTEEGLFFVGLPTAKSTKSLLNFGLREVGGLQFNSEGTQILVTWIYGSRTSVYDVASAAFLFEFHSQSVSCYSSDGTSIYGSNEDGIFCLDAMTGSLLPCQFCKHPLSNGEYYKVLCVLSSTVVILI